MPQPAGKAGKGVGKAASRVIQRPTPYNRPRPQVGGASNQGKSAPRGGYSVYVGNLAFRVSWQDLKDHFKQVGKVTHADVAMEPDGRSKGYGLVTFANASDARAAIEQLHDSEIDGFDRKIFVREDRDAPGGGGSGDAEASVYVGNLSWNVAWQDLKDHCKTAGSVVHADVMMEPDGRSKGCGIVQFASAREAAHAIATLNDTELNGRQIFLREDREAAKVSGAANVYVGNLSWNVTWQDLKDHCKTAGSVVHADVMMEPDGRSKGCGIVQFASAREAAHAIATLNDTELNGRQIFVREDREGGRAGEGYSNGGGQAGGPGCKLYVGNLSWEATWMDLKDLFREAGNVLRADVVADKEGRSRGFGTVLFATTREAARAIQLFNDHEHQGRPLDVRPDAFA